MKWTVTLEHADPESDPGLEEEVAKILQEEIDWEIMIDIMTEVGWTKIEMDWPTRMSESDAHEIKEWCQANLQGNYNGRAKIWLFEKSQDAVMFSLRWS
jgi:hypothetical protein